MTALTNTSITIKCPVSGVPKPTVTWTKDGLVIPNGGKYKVQEDGSLVISEADGDDNGQYTCTADSVAGKDSKSSMVKINGKMILKFLLTIASCLACFRRVTDTRGRLLSTRET